MLVSPCAGVPGWGTLTTALLGLWVGQSLRAVGAGLGWAAHSSSRSVPLPSSLPCVPSRARG